MFIYLEYIINNVKLIINYSYRAFVIDYLTS